MLKHNGVIFENVEKFEQFLKDNYNKIYFKGILNSHLDDLNRHNSENGALFYELDWIEMIKGKPITISYDVKYETEDCEYQKIITF